MKKVFTLLTLCALTLGAWAQTQNIYEWKNNSVTIRTTESFDSLTFALPAEAFVFTTGDPSDLTGSSMSATFELTSSLSISNASSTTEQGVCYSSEEAEPTIECSYVNRGTMSTGSWMARLTGLCCGTQYYYRPYLRIAGAVFYGEVKSFTTLDEDVESPYEAVDLGLSVKWASCNVGAEFPEEYGDYFAWGETTTKSDYSSSASLTYGLSNSELESRGIIGSNGNLTAKYDAATANWGGSWRMPTLTEMKELINNCTWTWTTQNGVNGYEVTGPNGNYIFLPATGIRIDTWFYDAGSDGHYWSATPDWIAYSLNFDSDGYGWGEGSRYWGFTVRPVSE